MGDARLEHAPYGGCVSLMAKLLRVSMGLRWTIYIDTIAVVPRTRKRSYNIVYILYQVCQFLVV